MNAVIVGITAMLCLSVFRMNVIISIFVGAIAAGLSGHLSMATTLAAFNTGLSGGSAVAFSYALLGAFAAALAYSGTSGWLALKIANYMKNSATKSHYKKWLLFSVTLLMAIASQNIIPIHIAFIPIMIPPLLTVFNKMHLDRRLIACLLVFGLTATYLIVPIGFGHVYLNQILLHNLIVNGVSIKKSALPLAMAVPVSGMFLGMLSAVFFSYRKPRIYKESTLIATQTQSKPIIKIGKWPLLIATMAIIIALIVQLLFGSILLGAGAGFLVMLATKLIPWKEADSIFIDGLRIMANVGFIMMAASGFGEVLRQTGDIPSLVNAASSLFGHSKALASLVMLTIGLFITLGIGSSFSTVPIIAAIFVPLAIHLGFSPLATASLLGTAGALGDAGSPVADSSLGPTMGLNMDGQHDHIRDTVLPTFLHYSLPMLCFGWIASLIL